MYLPSFDHPQEQARCLVSGTGLTHRKSAQTRNSMHTGVQTVTDSMRMYEWGVEGGRPVAGERSALNPSGSTRDRASFYGRTIRRCSYPHTPTMAGMKGRSPVAI